MGNANIIQKAGLEEGSKRYSQLVSMMENYNPSFDEKKYWAYGCNCLVLGDRPMSDPGKGAPVDALDTTCKKYKDCLKRARMNHGDVCIGEFHQYGMRITKAGEVVCRDDAGSCNRALCECDAMFAREHVNSVASYTDDYNMFYSQTGWDPMDQTPCSMATTRTRSAALTALSRPIAVATAVATTHTSVTPYFHHNLSVINFGPSCTFLLL